MSGFTDLMIDDGFTNESDYLNHLINEYNETVDDYDYSYYGYDASDDYYNDEIEESEFANQISNTVYITKANARRILRKTKITSDKTITSAFQLYKTPIYLFSKWEENYLLYIQSLFKDPAQFEAEFYKPIVSEDTLQYVFENDNKPAYHLNKECERLNSKFTNFAIPSELKERVKQSLIDYGISEVEVIYSLSYVVNQFREWFIKNIDLYENDPESFLLQLNSRWNIQTKIEEINIKNSGFEEFENYDLGQLENSIDEILSDAGKFYKADIKNQVILKKYQRRTFLADEKHKIHDNDTGLTDSELRSFLQEYNKKFKKPLKELLIQYYRVKYNPELSFDGNLLKRLGFECCKHCSSSDIFEDGILQSDNSSSDDYEGLPF